MTTKCITCTPNATLNDKLYFRSLKDKKYIIYRLGADSEWVATRYEYFENAISPLKPNEVEHFLSCEFNGDMSE